MVFSSGVVVPLFFTSIAVKVILLGKSIRKNRHGFKMDMLETKQIMWSYPVIRLTTNYILGPQLQVQSDNVMMVF